MGFLILRAMDERCLYDFIPDCIVCGLTNFCKLDTWGLKHMYAGLCAPGLMDLQRWDTFLRLGIAELQAVLNQCNREGS